MRIKCYYAKGCEVWSCWYQRRTQNDDVYERDYGSDKFEQTCETTKKAKQLASKLNGDEI